VPEGPFLVAGLARSGTAIALALAARGAQVIGVDAGAPAASARLREAGVELHADADGVAELARARLLVKSPGVPPQAPVVAAARERGVPVLGELELAWRMLANEFIAVTGTNGKTTTVELIAHIHRRAGLEVAVAGNVGTALSGLVAGVDPGAVIVCEVSSFQLEDAVEFSPEAAVLVNLTSDHLDRHGTLDAYAQAKARLFLRQRRGDIAVLPSAALEQGSCALATVGRTAVAGPATVVAFGAGAHVALRERDGQLWWRERPLLGAGELRLRGRHNLENAMAAAAACLARGVSEQAVREGLRTFPGVAHRLEQVACRDGVRFVNDSKATNVASTLVALEAYAPEGAVHLIAGGQGKGQDFAPLCEPVKRTCRAVYLIGEDAAAIAAALAPAAVPLRACGELQRAVAEAGRTAARGEVVLLSPACASFDQFADFEARGERFRELARS
jgi:UDP-N-acetylmuramoylalanine--D-glutamate ligase